MASETITDDLPYDYNNQQSRVRLIDKTHTCCTSREHHTARSSTNVAEHQYLSPYHACTHRTSQGPVRPWDYLYVMIRGSLGLKPTFIKAGLEGPT